MVIPILFAALLATALSLTPQMAQAQSVTLEPTAAAACLSLPQGSPDRPEYPFIAYKSNTPGKVLVELHFTGAELRPAVKVLSSSGDDSFVEAVEAHAKRLRVPCLKPGEEARLRQEFVFQTDGQPVSWGGAVDAREEERQATLRCLRHISGTRAPPYPRDALMRQLQGRVHARLHFNNDDQAPRAEVYATDNAQPLKAAIEPWVQGYRLPCYSGVPITARLTFLYRLEDDAFGFKPLDLLALASHVQGIRQTGLQMDTRSMGCPFDLKLLYLQPQLANVVGEVGRPDPRRAPLLAWLQQIKLDTHRNTADALFGDTADVSVPCVNIQVPPSGTAP